jgi:hypothetical protein
MTRGLEWTVKWPKGGVCKRGYPSKTVLSYITVFSPDAAKRQQFYIQQAVRKPQRATVQQHISRVLNDHVRHLPMMKDSPKAVPKTKKGYIPFGKADLAINVLASVPMLWQNQYNVNHSTVPKSTCTLLPDLERPLSKSWLRSTTKSSRWKVRLVQPDPKPRVTQSARRLGARLVKSLRRVAVRHFAVKETHFRCEAGRPSVMGHFQWPLCHRQGGWHRNLFLEYSVSKKVCLQLDIVEYSPGYHGPIYDLIIGKQTMHNLGVKLDFQEKTLTIDEILLPMRNFSNLQLKPRIAGALRETTQSAQEPISIHNKTKRMMKIVDAKYEKADLPSIMREKRSHLKTLR